MILISGKVIHGQKYGKVLGFPTANLDRRDYVRRELNVRLGVYAGVAEIVGAHPNRKFKAAIVIGPLDKHHLPKIEAHLLGFKGNLYGEKIVLTLGKFIRPFKKFKNEEDLKKQIKKDIEDIKKLGYKKTYGI